MLAVAALWLDAVLSVKVIHCVEPRTQAAGRDDDVNVMRKFVFDPRCSWLAFVTRPIWETELLASFAISYNAAPNFTGVGYTLRRQTDDLFCDGLDHRIIGITQI